MATKPVTYPQQIADLKTQLEQKDEQIAKLIEARDTIPLLNDEIGRLTGELAAKSKKDSQETGASKAQQTDLLQRAESAEAREKHLQTEGKRLRETVSYLESQIDLLGKNEFKIKDLQSRIDFLNSEIQTMNLRTTQQNQHRIDTINQLNQQLEQQANELKVLRMSNAQAGKLLERYQQHGDERVGPLEKQKEIDALTIANLMSRLDATNKAYETLRKDAFARIKSLEDMTEKQAGTIRELTIQRDRYAGMVKQFQDAVANESNNLSHLREIVGG
jgi:chromosome segregation ATPase